MANILDQIAKLIATAQLTKVMKEAEKELGNDGEILASLNTIRYANGVLEKKLDSFCTRHPGHILCKDKQKAGK